MIVSELIEKLKTMPQDQNVNIFDWRKNLGNSSGEATSIGVVSEIEVEAIKNEDAQAVDKGWKPWVALGFTNDDYDEDGYLVADYPTKE